MKKIKKIATSIGVVGKVLNVFSNSKENTYSCDYINNLKNHVVDKSTIASKSVSSQDTYTEMLTIIADKDMTVVLTTWLLFPKNQNGDRGICVKINGVEQTSEIVQSAKDNSTRLSISCVCNLKQNDTIQILTLQTSGSSLSVNGAYSMLCL